MFTALLIIICVLQVAALAMLWRLIRNQDEHLKNSERAWILAEFGWYEDGPAINGSTSEVEGVTTLASEVKLKLILRNEGKSPAWIEGVRGRAEIVAEILDRDDSEKADLTSFGALPAVGAGMEQARILQFVCPSQPNSDEFFSVYVVIDYRDIFGIKRKTTLGYSIEPSGEMMYRQDAYAQRNMNT